MTTTAKSNEPLLSVKGVSKVFDLSPPFLNRLIERAPTRHLRAVDGLDIAIPRGKTFSLVGGKWVWQINGCQAGCRASQANQRCYPL